jgi:hydroxymethylpyrimidine/phosphomethylpyrimidine kinase
VTPVVLTVGALDPVGADGLLADLRTFAALGVHGAAAVSLAGEPAEPLAPTLVAGQVRAALAGGGVRAVKLGALGSAATAHAVADSLAGAGVPVIADPSLAGGQRGAPNPELVEAWREAIPSLCLVVTPNLAEAATLTGRPHASTRGEMVEQGEALIALGCAHAVVSGGRGQGDTSTDVLVSRTIAPLEMRAGRLDRAGMRGLSATLAAAVAAHVAHGMGAFEAIHFAKLFVGTAIGEAERRPEGGPPQFPHQLARMWRRAGGEPRA